jgi:DNA recombination protein RmuC
MSVFEIAVLAGLAITLVLLAFLAVRPARGGADGLAARLDGVDRALERLEGVMRTEINTTRNEAEDRGRRLREEVGGKIDQFRAQTDNAGAQLRDEVARRLKEAADALAATAEQMKSSQAERLESVTLQLKTLNEQNRDSIEALRHTVEGRLDRLREENAAKLEEMRQTVDEKLQGTLEKRLGESFTLVSERLEMVHKGLGEMQTLATGVGDLKRVLTNVKVRGGWGEVQLGTLLEQMLSPEQYRRNARIKQDENRIVEYAIRLPGRDDAQSEVLLPIDSKFPQEDYERLVQAQERADAPVVEAAGRALEVRLRAEAKRICDKYIDAPATTDFAIMFLATEGLYAEAVRRPGLVNDIQQLYRVTVTGPTTLGALLTSLQMGFRTLAIEKRSSEVWKVLGEAKSEFQKYGDVMDKLKKQLDAATNTVDMVGRRTRAVERKLRGVEAIPVANDEELLALESGDDDET